MSFFYLNPIFTCQKNFLMDAQLPDSFHCDVTKRNMLVVFLMLSVIATLQAYTQLPF